MRILSLQPCSLYQNGGAGRLLRRLYQGRENQVISLYVQGSSYTPPKNKIKEICVREFPVQRSWMRWKLRSFFKYLREVLFFPATKRKLKKVASEIPFDVLHVINHGIYSTVLCENNFLKDRKLWVSFHDHFSTTYSSFEDASLLWNKADRRFLISKELGEEYQRLFGVKKFELITDGVEISEISKPKELNINNVVKIYFAGLLHLEYYPLFEVLADALDQMSNKGISFKLIMRGTQKLNFLKNRNFIVDYRSDFVSDKEVKEELDDADILYLPIKFSISDFYLYSLSTKMIGYLGSSGRILYHGPKDSAACKVLERNNAAISCVSLDVNDMIDSLEKILKADVMVSHNAKIMAKDNFILEDIQKLFWNISDDVVIDK